jgi:hypothetical protein
MKKSILTTAMAMAAAGAFAQGTMLVSNNNAVNSVTSGGQPLGPASGTTFEEELAVGTTATSLTEIAGSISPINQGYFYGPGATGVITLPTADGAPGATVFYDVEVWDSSKFASYAIASTTKGAEVGLSAVNSYVTPSGSPAPPPGPLAFASFTTAIVNTPEPATLALGALGLGSVLLFRRRK